MYTCSVLTPPWRCVYGILYGTADVRVHFLYSLVHTVYE